MFFGAKGSTFRNADFLRRNPTPAEVILWEFLRERQMLGVKFRRQHPRFKYVPDFYGNEVKLIIELDGRHHDDPLQKEYDHDREADLIRSKCTIIRFANADVFFDISFVLRGIQSTILELKSKKKNRRSK